MKAKVDITLYLLLNTIDASWDNYVESFAQAGTIMVMWLDYMSNIVPIALFDDSFILYFLDTHPKFQLGPSVVEDLRQDTYDFNPDCSGKTISVISVLKD